MLHRGDIPLGHPDNHKGIQDENPRNIDSLYIQRYVHHDIKPEDHQFQKMERDLMFNEGTHSMQEPTQIHGYVVSSEKQHPMKGPCFCTQLKAQNLSLKSVFAKSAALIYSVGAYQHTSTCGTKIRGLLYKTTDMGKHWEFTETDDDEVLWGVSANGRDAYAVGTHNAEKGIIYVTHNSGNHWTRITCFPDVAYFYGVSSPAQGVVYACGFGKTPSPHGRSNHISGVLYSSQDAGKTWSSVFTPSLRAIGFNAVCALNSRRIYLAGIQQDYNHIIGTVLYTIDGENWKRSTFQEINFHGQFYSIQVLYSGIGYVAGIGGDSGLEGVIYKTEDGGVSWYKLYNLPKKTILEFNDLCIINEDVVYVVGTCVQDCGKEAIMISTHNGGKSWNVVHTPCHLQENTTNLQSITCLNYSGSYCDQEHIWTVGGHLANSQVENKILYRGTYH